MNIEELRALLSEHFLAAYTAVNALAAQDLERLDFLAAYTAVNFIGNRYFARELFLAAYTAVN
ncbi:putative tRNA/rRNA methyltransferase [Pseudomonas aeruginosa]|nr:putative tRNA/rRNA methyltransferase [Pseudomonas aeruginosa]